MERLPVFPSFDYDTDKTNAGPRWQKWIDRLENLFVGMDIDNDDRKRALLLHYAGERVYDIYDAEKGDSDPTFDATKQVLKDYFQPKKNVQMEIFNFRSCKQKPSQTLDEFVTELRQLSKHCEFADADNEILSQLIQNCRSNRLRRRALREADANLKDILTLGRSLEIADNQAATMEKDTEHESVNKIKTGTKKPEFKQKHPHRDKQVQHDKRSASMQKKTCRYCGGEFPHEGRCPALGKTCNYCKKKNHFKKVCSKLKEKGKVARVQPQNQELSDSSDEEYCYGVEVVGAVNTVPTTELKLNQKPCKVVIDTGASVNILDEKTHNAIGRPKLKTKQGPKLLPYGGNQPLKVKGQCDITVETHNKISCETFYVVAGKHGSLLGYQSAKDLNLVKMVNRVDNPIAKFPDLLSGIGKLKNHKVKLHIDKSVNPVAIRHRRTPFHLREKIEKELDKLLEEDIIEKVEGTPTPWVSPIVTPPKKNPEEIRICVDMREPNKAITRERHLMPTTEELIHDLNGATVFSKLDLRSGYHQLELDEESRYITTFNTHAGMYRYKRLNFGISSAAEVFQETIRKVIQGIPGVKNISDDIVIFGVTQEDHDQALLRTLERLSENGLTLNLKKCELNKNRIEFFGMVFSSAGISPDPKKVQAVKDFKPPADLKELRSFLGMTCYCSRFIKDYATISEPIRRLTKQDVPWEWSDEQELSFTTIQDRLSDDSVVAYFDPKKEIKILVDASPVGLGAILSQDDRVVAYASRSLTDTESRYSQTEREALAIVWACEHFDIYLRGAKHFTVVTDHKPLEKIWLKPNPTLRIQRWGLRLQPYKLTIRYEPGANNPADYMSRRPVDVKKSKEEDIAEQYVNFVASEAVPKAITLDEIKASVSRDETMLQAIEFVRSGTWYKIKSLDSSSLDMEELKALMSARDELTVHSDNLLLKDDKLVIPTELRARCISIAHEGHQGMTKTKSYMRSKVWFPRMNQMIEDAIKTCLACQLVNPEPKTMEPLNMSDLPTGPWQNLSADFCGPLPTGEYLFVIIDEYTRYPVVEIIRSVSANTVIPVLDKVLAEFGFPRVIKSDNGSPFNSKAFKEYMENHGIEHRRITPRWPRANAQAESFNKPMMKIIRAAHATNQNWKQQLYLFLRQYRVTPHSATGFAPFSLLFKREPKTKLPGLGSKCNITDEKVRRNDEHAKFKAKEYADTRNKARNREITVGDNVLMKHDVKENKLSTEFKPKSYVVSSKLGNMVTATSKSGEKTTRNVSRFKKVDNSVELHNTEESSDNCDILEEEFDIPKSKPTQIVPQSMNSPRPTRMRREPKHFQDYVRF